MLTRAPGSPAPLRPCPHVGPLLSVTLFPPQPNKLTNTVALSSNLKTAAKTIIAEIGTNFYRADLQSAALAKASALCKAAKKSK